MKSITVTWHKEGQFILKAAIQRVTTMTACDRFYLDILITLGKSHRSDDDAKPLFY